MPYILPAIPPLAIVIADGLLTLIDRRGAIGARRLAAIGPLLGIAGAVAIAVAIRAAEFRAPYPMMVRPAIEISATILIVSGLACFTAFWMRRGEWGLALMILTGAAVLTAISYGRLMAEPLRSYARLAREIERLEPGARLVCYPRYVQALPFYCRRRVILVGGKTELTFGSEHDPDAADFFFIRRADLLKLWNDPRPTVFVIDRFALDPIRRLFGPFTIIASDLKKVAIMRTAPAQPKAADALTARPPLWHDHVNAVVGGDK